MEEEKNDVQVVFVKVYWKALCSLRETHTGHFTSGPTGHCYWTVCILCMYFVYLLLFDLGAAAVSTFPCCGINNIIIII